MPEHPHTRLRSLSPHLAVHQARMDRMYGPQLQIYDATRHCYLLGRNAMLRSIQPAAGESVLEIGCGTARNLLWLADRHPSIRLFGADISPAMLDAARASAATRGVDGRLRLAAAAAELLDVRDVFGCDHVDHVFFSYSLSMMPDWRAAFERGLDALAPGGTLHAVDFWDLADWPHTVRLGMRKWLTLFGVHCSSHRAEAAAAVARMRGAQVSLRKVAGRYAWRLRATLP